MHLALIVSMLLTAAADPELERLYLERVQAAAANRGEMPRYDPLEAVPGAADPRPFPAAPRPTIAADALAAARAYAERNASSAFIVLRDGKVEDAAYFGDTRRDTPIVSKSLAKPVTALAIGRAIRLGKIRSLDQSVADFITEWRGTPKAAIRIRHLLDMRSGLLAQGFSPDPQNIWSRAYLHPAHDRVLIEDYPLTDPPGSVYEYSNATSELVALVIGRATGMRYAAFVGRELLQPIGAAGGEVWIDRPGGLAHSGCCMMLPAESWARLGQLILDQGRAGGRALLPPGYVAEMMRGTAENPHYGLGLWVAGPYVERRGFGNPKRGLPAVLHSEPYLAADTVMFDGNSNQLVYIIPSERLVILRTGATPPKTPEWDNATLPNTILRGIARPNPARRAQPR